MMKASPHDILTWDEIEKKVKGTDKEVSDVAVEISASEIFKVKSMNRRARKRWLESKGIKPSEFKKL